MNCCQCQAIETRFNQKVAAEKLKQYRQKGPEKTTRLLLDALKAEGVAGLTLLDIGGGIGAIQHELLKTGLSSAIGVEASSAYLSASAEEAGRQGHADRIHHYQGNFTDLAATLPATDIVTLDRVICCYHDMPALVELSAARANKLYGLVYPRDTWWTKLGFTLENRLFWLQQNPFRLFVHPTAAVEAIVGAHGLQRRFYQTTGVWQVVVYGR
ncbi:MAG: class I SAM-dependent methyltransferase [Anaerolineae bacterium]|nr:class I SAM-dependent methyltransferase [Anaerolineae bacterium]